MIEAAAVRSRLQLPHLGFNYDCATRYAVRATTTVQSKFHCNSMTEAANVQSMLQLLHCAVEAAAVQSRLQLCS